MPFKYGLESRLDRVSLWIWTVHVEGCLDGTKAMSGSALVLRVVPVKARSVGGVVSLEAIFEDVIEPEVLRIQT